MTTVRPISENPSAARELTHHAIRARSDPASQFDPFLSAIERDVADGAASGVLRYLDGRAVGVALWGPRTALGLTVEVLHLEPELQTPREYRDFYREIAADVGPVAFAPGLLAGLSPTDEDAVMRELGFTRFARWEMRFLPDTPLPTTDPAAVTRSVQPTDEPELTRLHALAYRGHLDRYLFLTELDPDRDAAVQMRALLGGRWGEFLPWGSSVVEQDGGLVAASLVVRAVYGPLIAHVMVDPLLQGRGLGRSVVAATVHALRQRDPAAIVLNVTDGNERALRLYHRLGFVRTAGPSHGWYSTDRIRLPPSPT